MYRWALAMVLAALIAATGEVHAIGQAAASVPGVKAGEKIPSLDAPDQFGKAETFDSLRGKNGLLILFSRSADWCPYCKMHLVQLQAAKVEFEAKGIHVASLTYDSQDILKTFTERKGITYPMLSDPESRIIRAFGILNPEAKGFSAGIPYPGLYYITPDGVVSKRFFDIKFTDRFTPNTIYADMFGGVSAFTSAAPSIKAPHVSLKLSQSYTMAAPGSRVRLLVEIDPGAHMHLYAPGAEKNGYKVVKLEFTPGSEYRIEPVEFPPGKPFHFVALKETVPVYSAPSVLAEDIVMAATKEFNNSVGTGRVVKIGGTLSYQACDDHQCFLPVRQELNWEVNVQPFDSVRSPEAIRHK